MESLARDNRIGAIQDTLVYANKQRAYQHVVSEQQTMAYILIINFI